VALLSVAAACQAEDPAEELPSVEEATVKAHADVKQATDALLRLREEHANARRPLTAKLDRLQAEVKQFRADAESMQRARREAVDVREGLAARVESLTEEERFMTGLLTEYRRSLETRTSRAELQFLRERLALVDDELENPHGNQLLPRVAESLLSLAEACNAERLGGLRFPGEAVDGQGTAVTGTFAAVGPVVYFSAAAAEASGPTEPHLGGLCPAVFAGLTPEERTAVRGLCGGSREIVPVDVTLGDALKVAAARPSLVEHLEKGGVVMIPLAVVGVLAIALALVKTIALARVQVRRPAVLAEVIDSLRLGDIERARELSAAMRSPLREVVREGVEHSQAPKEHLEELMTERIMALIPALERHLALLAVLGGIAPLLGLLGTVTGMIHTFQLVTVFGTGDARVLSGGISEALVTTEVGLAIAIPVLLVHAFLARRVRTIVALLERVAAEFVYALKIQGRESD